MRTELRDELFLWMDRGVRTTDVLARRSGRTSKNVYRALRTCERYGLVKREKLGVRPMRWSRCNVQLTLP